jgi:hypothetical protein
MLTDTMRYHTSRDTRSILLRPLGGGAKADYVWIFPHNAEPDLAEPDFHERYERESCWTFVAISPETQLLTSDGSGDCPFLDPDQDLLIRLALGCWYAHPGLPTVVDPIVRRYIPLCAAIELERGEAPSIFAVVCGPWGQPNDVVVWSPPEVRGMVTDAIRDHAPVIDVWAIKRRTKY